MSGYGYTIIVGKTEYDMENEDVTSEQKFTRLLNDSSIKTITKVLTKNLKSKKYQCDLDHLMLFSTSFSNFSKWISFSCIYVISLEPIEHSLFLKDHDISSLIEDHQSVINKAGVYNSYASHRFNNSHQGDFFHLDEENNIVIHTPMTNSHGLVHSY